MTAADIGVLEVEDVFKLVNVRDRYYREHIPVGPYRKRHPTTGQILHESDPSHADFSQLVREVFGIHPPI